MDRKKPIIYNKFKPKEDQKLTRLVQKIGTNNWEKIANKMGTRNARQCKDRWTNYLNPDVNKEQWTEEEDKKLIELCNKYGSKWAEIGKYFNRTGTNVKNRWHLLKRKEKKTKDKNLTTQTAPQPAQPAPQTAQDNSDTVNEILSEGLYTANEIFFEDLDTTNEMFIVNPQLTQNDFPQPAPQTAPQPASLPLQTQLQTQPQIQQTKSQNTLSTAIGGACTDIDKLNIFNSFDDPTNSPNL